MRYLMIALLAVVAFDVQTSLAAPAAVQVSVSEFAKMQVRLDRRVDPCLPTAVVASRQERILLRVQLRIDGTLARRPVVLKAPTPRLGRLAAYALVKCINRRKPLKFDPSRYALWKQFTIALPPLHSRVTRLSR